MNLIAHKHLKLPDNNFLSRLSPRQEGLIYGHGIDDVPGQKETRIWNNDGTSKLIWIDPIYSHWKLMLRRVFIDKHYENTLLYRDWLSLSNYSDWFKLSLFSLNINDNICVDKDILSGDNSRYSPETCLIIKSDLNKLVLSKKEKISTLPIGVYFDTGRGNYQGYCKQYNGSRVSKRFNTVELAHKFWQTNKCSSINSYISSNNYVKDNPNIYLGLSRIVSDISKAKLNNKVTCSLKGYDVRDYLEGEYYAT